MKTKKCLSVLLAMCLALSLLPAAALAVEGYCPDSDDGRHESDGNGYCIHCGKAALNLFGSGSEEDPYRIECAEDWDKLAEYVDPGSGDTANMVFRLTADITVGSMIGSMQAPFAGTFDGDGHTLTLAIQNPGGEDCSAPFRFVAGAVIRNLKVDGEIYGGSQTTGLVAKVLGGSNLIENVVLSATIKATATDQGGFVGHGGSYETTLKNCVFAGKCLSLYDEYNWVDVRPGVFINGSDSGASVKIMTCLAVDTRRVGKGAKPEVFRNVYYLQEKSWVTSPNDWYSDQAKRAYTVTCGEGVAADAGEYGVEYDGKVCAAAGETIELTVTPAAGYALDTLTVKHGETTVSTSQVPDDDANKFTFDMPDGNVTVTAAFTATEPVFDTHSLILSGRIGMNFYMEIPEGYEDGTMTFTVGTGDSARTVRAEGEQKDDGRWVFTCPVNSIEMAEDITAAFSYGENQTVTRTASVQDYLEYIIGHRNDDAAFELAEPLAKAIWNYGYFAQQSLRGGGKHASMPPTYAGETDLNPQMDRYEVGVNLVGSDVTAVFYSLDLDSETAINIYLTSETVPARDDVIVKATEGTTFDYAVEKTRSGYRVKITGIGAHELGSTFVVTVPGANITASALSYVRQALGNNDLTEEDRNTAAALYAYYTAAVDCKAALENSH